MTFKPGNAIYKKMYLSYLITIVIVFILSFLIKLFIPETEYFPIIIGLGINLVFLIIVLPLQILWTKNLMYEITNSSIIIYSGIISKTEQNINFEKVTDFQLHRSLFDRILNISTINIQTAGQSANNASRYEASLIGLENWEELYPNLKSRISGNSSQLSENETDINSEILKELRLIRQLLEKK